MERKTQGESRPQQLETGTRPPTGTQDKDQSIPWLHLPDSALGWQVPLAKASRQVPQTLPFSLVGFGELSEAVEKDNHKDIPLTGPSSGSALCVAWVGRDVTFGLWEEAHVSLQSRRRCGSGHCSHIILA